MTKLQRKDRWDNFVFRKIVAGFPVDTKVKVYRNTRSRCQWLCSITNSEDYRTDYIHVIANNEGEAANLGFQSYKLAFKEKKERKKYTKIVQESDAD